MAGRFAVDQRSESQPHLRCGGGGDNHKSGGHAPSTSHRRPRPYLMSGLPARGAMASFEKESGGYLDSGYVIRRVLYPAMKRAGVPRPGEHGRNRTFHSLRHSFARIALENGAEITLGEGATRTSIHQSDCGYLRSLGTHGAEEAGGKTCGSASRLMPRRCTICIHPARADIDASIVRGEAFRRIAAHHGVTEQSVRRHRADHLASSLVKAEEAQVAQAISP